MSAPSYDSIQSFIFVGDIRVGETLMQGLRSSGYEVAAGIEDADAILIYCESQNDLEDVFFESNGLIQQASSDTYLINLSPSTPNFAKEMNAVALVSDLHPIEAPLFVIDPVVDQAFLPSNLSCFLSGEEADICAVAPFIGSFVEKIEVIEAVGSAQLAHAALTIRRSAQIVATMEAEALHNAFGISSDVVSAFAESEGFCNDYEAGLLRAVKEERFTGDYTIAIWISELTAALMAADDIELILPGAEACMHLLELLMVIDGGSKNPAVLSLVYGEESACAKHGLDWTRAEEAYREEHVHDENCDHDHGDDYLDLGGFGTYSSN